MAGGATILDEIRRCQYFGESAVQLLVGVVETIGRTAGFPPPVDHTEWTSDAVFDVVADWAFDETSGRARVLAVAAATELTNDDDLERYLRTAIRNHLRDVSRSSEAGARIRAIRRVAAGDPDVVVLTPKPVRYARPDATDAAVYAGDPAVLLDACRGVTVTKLPWTSERRREPIATAATIRSLIRTIIDTAGSPVLEATVADVIVKRCQPQADAIEQPSAPEDIAEHLHGTESTTAGSPSGVAGATPLADERAVDSSDVLLIADDIWNGLSERERSLLFAITQDWSLRTIEQRLGISKSTANRIQPRLTGRLPNILPSDELGKAVLAELARRSQRMHFGTEDEGSPLDEEVGQPDE